MRKLKINWKTAAAQLPVLIPLALLVAIALYVFASIPAGVMYGTNDRLYFVWRYLCYAMLGAGLGVALRFAPLGKVKWNHKWSKKKSRVAGIIAGATTLLWWLGLLALGDVWFRNRWLAWLHPEYDPSGSGWFRLHPWVSFTSAQWFGGRPFKNMEYWLRGNPLNYVLYRHGRALFLAIVVLWIALLCALLWRAWRMEKGSFARCAVFLTIAWFGFCLLCNLSEQFEGPPIPAIPPLPFFAYRPVAIVVNFMLAAAMTRHRGAIMLLDRFRRPIDIGSDNDDVASRLSNFTERHFVFDGIECASIEGALQSFKFNALDMQREICALIGYEAKKAGRKADWKAAQILYWDGKAYPRDSREYQDLLDRLYFEVYLQDEQFAVDLHETGYRRLVHTIGNGDPAETVLTEKEFCDRLMKLRDYHVPTEEAPQMSERGVSN